MHTNIIAFIVVLGVLIFFHELGHFLMARWFRVGVERFSLGFGPKIFGKTVGITDYRLSAIPLGGYVKMVGEEPGQDIEPENIPFSFTHKPVYQRMVIVAAGPLFNLLLALLLFLGVFQWTGLIVYKPCVKEVEKESPADISGLQKGDLIVFIDDKPVESWDDMASMITSSNGKLLSITYMRGDQQKTVQLQPKVRAGKNIFGESVDRYMIGVSSCGDHFVKPLNPFQALYQSVLQTYKISELTLISIIKLIQGAIPSDNIGGPIMIAQMAGEQAREGFINLLVFIAVISINLGILNFLPIPVLDGGHLLFFAIEGITGKPVSIRVREIAQQIGIFLLISLMIFAFYNDITRVFFN
ncbi:MAG: RIP metalloprotease RseP [Desulfobacterales bacterium]|nr:RIP metalloprotease RseP [Desulfobacterales bacterium]